MRRTVLFLAGLVAPAALLAQLPTTSPRSLALGGAYTSLARGWEAVSWNPALLAARGRPRFTLGLPQLSFEFGSNSYGFGDFRKYANRTLDAADKAYLLGKIDTSLTVREILAVSPVGISIGRFAFTAATSGDMDASLGKDAVDLALNGNAHRSGPGEYFTARGSGANGWAATTLAGSFAWPFQTSLGRLALGATYKRVIGHFIGRAAETSSSFQVNPAFDVSASGHTIYTDYSRAYRLSGPGDLLGGEGKAGSGYGVDLGATLELEGRSLMLSAVIVNALGGMSWDEDRFAYERSAASVSQTAGGQIVDDTTRVELTTKGQIDADPQARGLRDSLLAHAGFARVVRAGMALRRGALSLAAGGQLRLSKGLDRVPSASIGAGAEIRLLRVLPLRAGAATDFNSVTLSAGSGLQLLGLNADISVATISGSKRPGVVLGLGIGFIY